MLFYANNLSSESYARRGLCGFLGRKVRVNHLGLKPSYREELVDCTLSLVSFNDISSLIFCAFSNDNQEVRAACSGEVR